MAVEKGFAREELVGCSPPIRDLRGEIVRAAATSSTLLITGETGSGKGLAARLVHRASLRAGRSWVHVDCASLATTVIESELFGHERGAFTGAIARRPGRFELAGEGTVFLDEIGELEPRLQSKLLRVLEDRAFERLGGVRTLPMRARVIAATSRNLKQSVREHRFRADLYFRLAVLHLETPPLRNRLEDLPQLVQAGLERAAARLGVPTPGIRPDLLERLRRHSWPGNIRELMNLLERCLVREPGETLHAGSLEGLLDGLAWTDTPTVGPPTPPLRSSPGSPVGVQEQTAAVLVAAGGNVSRAARRLGIPRGTLRYRIQRFGLAHLIPRD